MLTQQWARPPIEMAASKKTVQLFYDILSPYSWVAFEVATVLRSACSLDSYSVRVNLGNYGLAGCMS